jgi:hypothetical protein
MPGCSSGARPPQRPALPPPGHAPVAPPALASQGPAVANAALAARPFRRLTLVEQ